MLLVNYPTTSIDQMGLTVCSIMLMESMHSEKKFTAVRDFFINDDIFDVVSISIFSSKCFVEVSTCNFLLQVCVSFALAAIEFTRQVVPMALTLEISCFRKAYVFDVMQQRSDLCI